MTYRNVTKIVLEGKLNISLRKMKNPDYRDGDRFIDEFLWVRLAYIDDEELGDVIEQLDKREVRITVETIE